MFTNIFRICSLALAVFLSVLFISGTNAFANTDEINQAAVVIDTGKEIKTACITFRGDSISGTQALELANAQPVFQSFSGNGSAVCSLCGVGCPSGNSCLTCMGSSFWNYFRAPKDSSKFSLSGAGAGVVRVKDGDVEGW